MENSDRNILLVNACVRKDSRTSGIADRYLRKRISVLEKTGLAARVTELDLDRENMKPLSRESLDRRMAFTASGSFEDPMFRYAREFAAADEVVIAAPYWDLSFPALLKIYMENITVTGITFVYTAEGRPRGLCRASRLVYVTTSGGPVMEESFGYGYIRALGENMYGIGDVRRIGAAGLDIDGADVEKILKAAYDDADKLAEDMADLKKQEDREDEV